MLLCVIAIHLECFPSCVPLCTVMHYEPSKLINNDQSDWFQMAIMCSMVTNVAQTYSNAIECNQTCITINTEKVTVVHYCQLLSVVLRWRQEESAGQRANANAC